MAFGALDIATQLEALLAIGDTASLKAKATEYADAAGCRRIRIHKYTSPIHRSLAITSKFRARLNSAAILEAAGLRESGGSIRLSGDQARTQLEALAGKRKSVSLEWYELGLVTARSM